MLINKNIFSAKNLLNVLISLIPLSIIIGNFIINLNVILVCLLGLIIYRFEIFKLDKKIYQYLIYSFFLYIILITLYKNLPNLEVNILFKEHIIKSFLFLRFFIFFLVISKIVEEGSFNTKLFFISSAFFSFIVAVDILVQVYTGTNLLGLPITLGRPSSFFGGENIAGGYLQKFSFFFIFLGPIIVFKSLNKKIIFVFLSFSLFFLSILLTNNRMPFLIYCFSLIIFLFFEKRLRKFFLFTIIFSLISFFIIIKNVTVVKDSFNSLYTSIKHITLIAPKLFYYKEIKEEIPFNNGYLIVFNSGIQQWKENKIFGDGLKSFRINCEYGHNRTCQSHPHNYFIEIMIDTGLIGLSLICLIFIFVFFNFLKYYSGNANFQTRLTTMPFFLIFFFEFFPLRSSGSFFTSSNSILIFLSLAILINIKKIDNVEKN